MAESVSPNLFERWHHPSVSVLPDDQASAGSPWRVARLVAGIVLGLALIAYVAGVVTGRIPTGQRVSISDLAVLVVGIAIVVLLLRPQLLDVVQLLEIGNVRLQLRDLRDQQQTQRHELDEIRFVLHMLVTENERRHLQNLDAGRTSEYRFSIGLPAELRRLRGIDLVKSKRGVFELPTKETFDLNDFVELTDRGRDYLRRSAERAAGAGGPV
jgi:hypothetical protein